MYYTEKIIDGKLYFKTSPGMDWEEVSSKTILRRMIDAEKKLKSIKEVIA